MLQLFRTAICLVVLAQKGDALKTNILWGIRSQNSISVAGSSTSQPQHSKNQHIVGHNVTIGAKYTAKIQLLDGKTYTIISSHKRNSKTGHCLSKNTSKQKFTILMPSYGVSIVRGVAALGELLSEEAHVLRDKLGGIMITYTKKDYAANSSLEPRLIASNAMKQLNSILKKSIGQKYSTDIPIEVAILDENAIDSKFAFGSFLCTDNVMHIDDDVKISPIVLQHAYQVYTNAGNDRILGFYKAYYDLQSNIYHSQGNSHPPKDQPYEFILTGAAFLNATRYHPLYFLPRYAKAVDVVRSNNTGEDILMNVIVANDLADRNELLMIAPTSNSVYGHAIYYNPYQNCEKSNTLFTIDYGRESEQDMSKIREYTVPLGINHDIFDESGKISENAGLKRYYDVSGHNRAFVISYMLENYGKFVTAGSQLGMQKDVCFSDDDGYKQNVAISYAREQKEKYLDTIGLKTTSSTTGKKHSQLNFHILIMFGNQESTSLQNAINSATTQLYTNKTIWMIRDGIQPGDTGIDELFNSTCTTQFHASKPPKKDVLNNANYNGSTTRVMCTTLPGDGHGPAFGKYFAFRILDMSEIVMPHDVVLVLDGDDKLSGPNTVDKLFHAYNDNDCFMSWGSCEGKYCDQGGDLLPGVNHRIPRKNKVLFTHPRSFQSRFIRYFKNDDLFLSDGYFPQKATDIGYIYRLLDLVEAKNRCFIKDVLYSYDTGSGGISRSLKTTQAQIDKTKMVKQLEGLR